MCFLKGYERWLVFFNENVEFVIVISITFDVPLQNIKNHINLTKINRILLRQRNKTVGMVLNAL